MSTLKSEVDLPESIERRRFFRDVLIPGGIAGGIGGVISGGLASATCAVIGQDPALPLRLLAGAIFRGYALEELGAGAAFWGAVLLLGLAVGAGVTFSLLLPRGGTAMAGLFWAAGFGVASYMGLVQLGLWADPLLEHELPAEALFPYVLLLGICCALVVPLRRLFAIGARLRSW